MPQAIAANLAEVETAIAAACARSDRERSYVTLVAVSKTVPPELVDAAVSAGVTDVGENRVQELESKIQQIHSRPRWHLIGHLQSNKSRLAAKLFDVVQTLDSEKLARRLDQAAAELGRRIEVLIQVNIGREAQKSGTAPEEVLPLARSILSFPNLDLRGLMTIPPVGDENQTRGFFREMARLQRETAARLGEDRFSQLSMGMSADYEIAIEEGATIVRVGTAIFGRRAQ
jgi:PLP dependent protein